MKNHTCTGKECATCSKSKNMMVAILVGVLIIGGVVIAMRSNDTSTMQDVAEVMVAEEMAEEAKEMMGEAKDMMGMSDEEMAAQMAGMTEEEKMQMKKDAAMMGAGVYAVYAPELVGKTERTILSFSATWCPSCQSFKKDIMEKRADIPAGVTVLRVDYDTYGDLKKKYGVRSQHTFVEVDKNGAPIKTVVGSADLKALIDDFSL